MNKLIHSEIRKLATTRWFKITMAITIMMAPAFTLLGVFTATQAQVGDDEFVHGVLKVSVVSSLVHARSGNRHDGRRVPPRHKRADLPHLPTQT